MEDGTTVSRRFLQHVNGQGGPRVIAIQVITVSRWIYLQYSLNLHIGSESLSKYAALAGGNLYKITRYYWYYSIP